MSKTEQRYAIAIELKTKKETHTQRSTKMD